MGRRSGPRRRPPPPQFTLAGLLLLVTLATVVFAVARAFEWGPSMARSTAYFIFALGPGFVLLASYLLSPWFNPWFVGLVLLCLLMIIGPVGVYFDCARDMSETVDILLRQVGVVWVIQIVIIGAAPLLDRRYRSHF